jgi:tripartite-type tricarboxylate transporter receptor subunit TctC
MTAHRVLNFDGIAHDDFNEQLFLICGPLPKGRTFRRASTREVVMSHALALSRALVVLSLATAAPLQASYPERPIRYIHPSAPGASSDTLTRILMSDFIRHLGQQVVIDNRPGGVGSIGTSLIVRAKPDGYTIGYGNIVSLAIGPALTPVLPYNVDKDLAMVGQFISTYNMLAVTNSLPVKSVKELIEYARQNPGKLSNASSGNGTSGHLGGELFKTMTGTRITHVPYKGSVQGIADLTTGQVQLMFDNLPSISPHVKAGRVRALGVSSSKRSPIFPDIPTISEAGVPGYETNSWGGIVAPAGTPRAVIDRLNSALNKALQSPEVMERYASLQAEPVGGTPEAFDQYVRKERVKWAEVVRKAGAKAD